MSKTIREARSAVQTRRNHLNEIRATDDPYKVRDAMMDLIRKTDDQSEILLRMVRGRRSLETLTKQVQRKLVEVLGLLDDMIFSSYGESIEEKQDETDPKTVSRWGVAVPQPNLGIPRSKMPQISAEYNDEFIDFVKSKTGKDARKGTVKAGELNSTQNELNLRKVAALMKKFNVQDLAKIPLLVSQDKYVLDGHHRWASVRLKDPNARIPTILFGVPMRQLLKLALSFPKTFKQGVKEHLRKYAEAVAWNMAISCAIQEAARHDASLVESLGEDQIGSFIEEVMGYER